VRVTIGGIDARSCTQVGRRTAVAGLFQLNVKIPAGPQPLPNGRGSEGASEPRPYSRLASGFLVVLTIGGVSSRPGVFIDYP